MAPRLQKMIESRKNLSKTRFTTEAPMRPIVNFQNYYETKIRVEGHESEHLRKLKEYHDNLKIRPPRELNRGYMYPHGYEHIGVGCHVTKSGHVKVTVCLPFVEQYTKYHSKGENVPVKEKVRLMKLAGYPEEILKKIIEKDLNFMKEAETNKKFLEKIFGSK